MRRWMRANPRPRGGTADRRMDAEAPREEARLRRGRRSDREGDAIGSEMRVSAAAAEAMEGGGGRRTPNPRLARGRIREQQRASSAARVEESVGGGRSEARR